jgi:hypothetical protein
MGRELFLALLEYAESLAKANAAQPVADAQQIKKSMRVSAVSGICQ